MKSTAHSPQSPVSKSSPADRSVHSQRPMVPNTGRVLSFAPHRGKFSHPSNKKRRPCTSGPLVQAGNFSPWLLRLSGPDAPEPVRDYELGKNNIILGIMLEVESRVRKGQTPETIAPIVATWAGRWSKWVQVETAKGGLVRKQRRLILTVANPAVAMELRPRLAALRAQLQPHGITEVSMR